MRTRRENWLALIAVGAGLLLLAILGIWMIVHGRPPVHSKAQDVPTVAHSTPLPKWAAAVEQARQVVRADLVQRNLPGLSVAVGVDGETVWAEGFGFADIERRIPVTPRHKFRVGTASAMLTSAAAGRLLEQGKLKLDDEIQTYVPAFPKKQWPVTLRALMGHTAGLVSDGGDESPLFGERCEQPADALRFFAGDALLFQPGTEYRYSRYGWIVVSAAIQAAAGEPFLQYIREQIFEPLGMRDTVAERGPKPLADQAISYFPRLIENTTFGLDVLRDLEYSCYAGSSVFLSTPSDLVRFGMALKDGKLLKPETVQLLQSSQRLLSGEESGHGLGWDLRTVTLTAGKAKVVGHNGDVLGGTATAFLMLPERGITVSVMSNTSYADPFSIGVKIADLFTREPGR